MVNYAIGLLLVHYVLCCMASWGGTLLFTDAVIGCVHRLDAYRWQLAL